MIFGVGVDIVDIDRIRRALERRGERFARRVLTDGEWPGYLRARDPAVYVADRFAAKEAFSKALGTGFRFPATLHGIGVANDRLGKPYLRLRPELEQLLAERGIVGHHVSISDEKSLACAFVVLETA